MLIDSLILQTGVLIFPKVQKYLYKGFEFQNLLLDEVLSEVKKTNIASEKLLYRCF